MIPKNFIPNKSRIKELTKKLLTEEQNKYGDLPLQVIYSGITLEEIKNSEAIEDKISYIETKFKHEDFKYHITFLPCRSVPRKESVFQLTQWSNNGKSCEEKIKILTEYIAEYYSGTSSKVSIPYAKGRVYYTNIYPPFKLHVDQILDDIKTFFTANFEEVEVLEVKYRDVTQEDLRIARLPKAKQTFIHPI